MHLKKYEWVGSPDIGDCSLWVRSAALEFDDGLWQCQVTASDFTTQDALASEPARLVVRGELVDIFNIESSAIVHTRNPRRLSPNCQRSTETSQLVRLTFGNLFGCFQPYRVRV